MDLTCDAETVAVSTAEKKKTASSFPQQQVCFTEKKKENNNTSVWKNASQGFPPTLCLKNTNETIVIIVITSRDAVSHMLITGLLRIPVKTNVTSHPPGLKYIAAVSNPPPSVHPDRGRQLPGTSSCLDSDPRGNVSWSACCCCDGGPPVEDADKNDCFDWTALRQKK